MFSPWRTRPGTRGSVTTAWPRAASVGARMIPTMTASQNVNTSKLTAAASAPRAIVSGRPIPSRRSGTEASRRSSPRSMRDASAKSTSASVASASARTVELVLARSIPSRTFGPTRRPIETKTIAGVIGDPDRRFETTATTISASAKIARDHSIQIRLAMVRSQRGAYALHLCGDCAGSARLRRRERLAAVRQLEVGRPLVIPIDDCSALAVPRVHWTSPAEACSSPETAEDLAHG